MLHSFSKTIASFFTHKRFISKNQIETYTYCFEFLLSTLLFSSSIIFIAWMNNAIVPSIFFYISFYYFRSVLGGFHAKSHFRCYVLSITTFFIFLVLYRLLNTNTNITLIFLLLSSYLIIRYAPIAHKNRLFSYEEYRYFRKKSLYSLFLFWILVLSLIMLQFHQTAFCISYGIAQAAISLFVAHIIYSIERSRAL